MNIDEDETSIHQPNASLKEHLNPASLVVSRGYEAAYFSASRPCGGSGASEQNQPAEALLSTQDNSDVLLIASESPLQPANRLPLTHATTTQAKSVTASVNRESI